MEELLETIQKATKSDADASAKQAGANACRAILAALETEPGAPLAPPPVPSSSLAAVAAQLQSAPPGLVLDALIAKLRTYLPPEEPGPSSARPDTLRIPFVSIPSAKKPGEP